MEDRVSKTEYDNHKGACSKSFDSITEQLELLNRAVFGDKKLDDKGIYEMTKEMYKATMYAKGGQKLFLVLVKIAGGLVTIWAAFELFYKGK